MCVDRNSNKGTSNLCNKLAYAENSHSQNFVILNRFAAMNAVHHIDELVKEYLLVLLHLHVTLTLIQKFYVNALILIVSFEDFQILSVRSNRRAETTETKDFKCDLSKENIRVYPSFLENVIQKRHSMFFVRRVSGTFLSLIPNG